ncbi:hypothetical protein RvY_08132 [Ramazzottius varieornatus]|uniref:MD-2-related lipid-recognition domain-containing protein n=1 Tax=Ramazzottius varieornatus TaxID=947166 RepID=A0A1D1V4U2_RAMVA|nr:hypothetical protein RvY_08132 [Ramazzottius varieornatus]
MAWNWLRILVAIALIALCGTLSYLHLTTGSGFSGFSSSYSSDAASGVTNEVWQLEAVIRNATNATSVQIGTVYSDCTVTERKSGSVILREFGNQTKEVWLVLQLSPQRTVESGLINIRVSYNGNKLFSTHYDLCKKLLPSLKCPLLAGRHTYGLRHALPAFALPGTYGIEARIVDQKNELLACVIAELPL